MNLKKILVVVYIGFIQSIVLLSAPEKKYKHYQLLQTEGNTRLDYININLDREKYAAALNQAKKFNGYYCDNQKLADTKERINQILVAAKLDGAFNSSPEFQKISLCFKIIENL